MPMPYPGIYQLLAEAEKRALGVHRSRFLETDRRRRGRGDPRRDGGAELARWR